jgi:hypothetical protein
MVEQIGAHAHGLFSHHRGLWETRAQIYTQKPEKAILGTRAAAESGRKMNQWGKFTPPEKAGWARVAAAGRKKMKCEMQMSGGRNPDRAQASRLAKSRTIG